MLTTTCYCVRLRTHENTEMEMQAVLASMDTTNRQATQAMPEVLELRLAETKESLAAFHAALATQGD